MRPRQAALLPLIPFLSRQERPQQGRALRRAPRQPPAPRPCSALRVGNRPGAGAGPGRVPPPPAAPRCRSPAGEAADDELRGHVVLLGARPRAGREHPAPPRPALGVLGQLQHGERVLRPACGHTMHPGTVTGRAGPNRAGPGLTLAPRPRRCHGNAPAPRPAAHLRPPPPSSRSACHCACAAPRPAGGAERREALEGRATLLSARVCVCEAPPGSRPNNRVEKE